MKIAIVGCGALGSYYGAMLFRDGQEVHFLLRSDYEAVRRNGVFIRSPAGDFNARPQCARTPEEIGVADLVVIGLKTTANDQLTRLLPPLVGPHTIILTLQNGLGNEEQLARLFPPGQIMGGLCFVCLNRIQPGVIQHTAHGVVVLGEFQRWPEPRTHDIATMFQHAGISCKVTDHLARAHWEKLVWNIPFNGLGVAGAAGYDAMTFSLPSPEERQSRDEGALDSETKIPSSTFAKASADGPRPSPRSGGERERETAPGGAEPGPCLTTDKLLADPRWEKLVRELMAEVLAVSKKLGFEIPESFAEKQVERTRAMGAYKASTLVDFERGMPLEIESLFGEPLRLAQQAIVPVPRLEALCQVLRQLDPAVRRKPDANTRTIRSGQTVAFLGDSITDYGWGKSYGYVRLVAAGLEARHIRINVIAAGVCGHKSSQMLKRLGREVLNQKPDWMVLSCGINDVWQGPKGVPLEQFKKNIMAIVERCQAAGIRVMILTTTVIGEDLGNELNGQLAPYNEFLRQVAREKGCLLADLNQLFQEVIQAGPKSGDLLTTDGTHLNEAGNRLMAAGVLRAFGFTEGVV